MILVTGGTGFVGGHLIKRLTRNSIPVRTVVRNPKKAQALKDLGVDVVPGDISDRTSLNAAAAGAERVIHLVGIIQEGPGFTYRSVHVEGTRNILDAAKMAGIKHFFFQSALGARPGAVSQYHKTKWEAEELVRSSGIAYTILRPSLIYGPGDLFTVRLSEMMRLSPVLPVIGSGKSKIQPIFIDDVVNCIKKAVTSDAFLNKVFEIGGPEQLTYEEVTLAIAEAMGIERPMVHMPMFFMKSMAKVMETVLPKPPVTMDQLIMLQEDNVCGMKDIRETFGVEPMRFREGLQRFIRRSVV
jgi:NADH dehydrogenase